MKLTQMHQSWLGTNVNRKWKKGITNWKLKYTKALQTRNGLIPDLGTGKITRWM